MAFTRDRGRILVGAQTVGITSNAGGTYSDLGYLVEDSLKVKTTPQIIRDESGVTREVGHIVEYEFELLQGDRTMLTDLESLQLEDEVFTILMNSVETLANVPINIELEQNYTWTAPRTIKVKGATKCKNISDIWVPPI